LVAYSDSAISCLFGFIAIDAIVISDVELAMNALELIPTVCTLKIVKINSDPYNLRGGIGINTATGLSVCARLEVLEASSDL
jgi:hypothetical protein